MNTSTTADMNNSYAPVLNDTTTPAAPTFLVRKTTTTTMMMDDHDGDDTIKSGMKNKPSVSSSSPPLVLVNQHDHKERGCGSGNASAPPLTLAFVDPTMMDIVSSKVKCRAALFESISNSARTTNMKQQAAFLGPTTTKKGGCWVKGSKGGTNYVRISSTKN